MSIKRENVAIAVRDLEATIAFSPIAFFTDLGLTAASSPSDTSIPKQSSRTPLVLTADAEA